ncbi:MAG: heparinase II/III family protein [Phycisphaerae bacterium]|nr:heparinase II/III family protein [Phycisphaerae bacterium]
MIKRSVRRLSFVFCLLLCLLSYAPLVSCAPPASEAAQDSVKKREKTVTDYIFPAGGGKWKGASKEIPGEITWDIARSGNIRSNDVLRDWTPYNALVFTVESNRVLGSPKIRLVIGSKNKSYYSGYVRINFKGTKNIVIPFDEFGWSKATMNLQLGSLDKSGLAAKTNPRLGLQRINNIQFTISGYRCGLWSRQERAGTVLKIRDLRLVKIPISKVGPRISDKQLFAEMLDLDYPGLEKVKSAVKKGDFKAARHELAEHIRRRKKPVWLAPNERSTTGSAGFRENNIKHVEAIMSHKFNVRYHRHIYHDFGKHINWCVHPLSKGPNRTIEWNSMLNRHFHFSSLAHAYQKTGDEKYARELAQQMNSFIRDCPVLLNSSGNRNAYHGPWVTLNTALRYQDSWPDVIFDCLQSPNFTDDIIVNIVKSSAEHARHLVENYTGHNWLTAESLAVYTIGTIFPEYKEAKAWRQFGITKLYNQLENYVYPDGIMHELALGYNCWVLEEFARVLQIAEINGRLAELPADYKKRIEKMFNYLMYDCMPDGKCFGLNDSWNTEVTDLLRKGYRLFPGRSDLLYPISAGKEGKRPARDSIAMPYSGHYIMRSGWDKNARILHFDGGLLGSGHDHEDKLHVAMYAYGKLLLPDAGTYSYNRSKWRAYVLKTRSHNTVLVDGMDQIRKSAGRRFKVWPKPWDAPSPATDTQWTTTHGLDYVAGFYRYKYREYTDWQHRKKHPKTLDSVQHARKILFVKPDFWIIHDVLTSKDDKKHTCDVLFHINADKANIDPKTNAVTSACKGAANVAIFPLNTGRLKVKIVEGKANAPIQGWTRPGGKKHPDYPMNTIPTAIFNKTWHKGTDVVTVVYPFPAGVKCPVKSVTPIESKNGVVAAKITLAGSVEHIYLSNPKPGEGIRLAAIETDGEVAEACAQPGKNLRLLLVNGRSLAVGDASVTLGKRGSVSVTGYSDGIYRVGTDTATQCTVKIPGLAKNAKVEIHKIDNDLNRTKKINATVTDGVIKFTTEAGGAYEIGIVDGRGPGVPRSALRSPAKRPPAYRCVSVFMHVLIKKTHIRRPCCSCGKTEQITPRFSQHAERFLVAISPMS